MSASLDPSVLHGAARWPAPLAGAFGAVGDDSAGVASEPGIVGAESDGPDLDMVHGTVAALYVDPRGVYSGLAGVEVWDEARDARGYAGPWPVVAHPPCARWSRLAGFTEARFGYKRGEDGGCFEAALRAVRTFGGVLEHPAFSKAWDRYGLSEPLWREGWTLGLDGGASCYVEQGRYGLPVKKATWLYAYGVELPDLRWGFTLDGEGEEPNGPHGGIDNWRDRWQAPQEGAHPRALGGAWRVNRHNGMRAATPPEFRDALIAIALTA